MNSLLQCLYMTPELRRAIYDLDPEELGSKFVSRAAAIVAVAIHPRIAARRA
jgi:sensor histidine kinase regulating citrate/malate metabolism